MSFVNSKVENNAVILSGLNTIELSARLINWMVHNLAFLPQFILSQHFAENNGLS